MKFDLPTELASIIKVIGVGGGGSNAVNHMYEQGIKNVDFIVCNTDRQALDISPVPVKLQLGVNLTEGLGAGSIPERGRDAIQENIEEVRELLSGRTKMVFITAGMGGGTGTGAAPVIAEIAREMGILTVGIVTSPFMWEGRQRRQQALDGIEEMRKAVDTLLVINNDRLRELYGNLSLSNAFNNADNILTTAAKGIAGMINETGDINVDFQDVKTVMTNSGVAIMGMAQAEGEDRAMRAAQEALDSPLLNDNDISGARYVLFNITYGTREILMDEISEITELFQAAAGNSANMIWGYGKDETLGDEIRITLIATGFQSTPETVEAKAKQNERTVIPLMDESAKAVTAPIANPVGGHSAPAAPVAPPAIVTPAEPYILVRETPAPLTQGALPFSSENHGHTAAPEAPKPQPEQKVEKVVLDLYDTADQKGTVRNESPEVNEARLSQPEHQARVEERQARMREVAARLRTTSGLADMENEPAYKRKNLHLNDAPHSTESNVSRYTLNEEVDETGERRVELRRNNPYLHDNVD